MCDKSLDAELIDNSGTPNRINFWQELAEKTIRERDP